MVGRLLNNFKSFFQWIIHIAGSISVRLPKKVKIIEISPLPLLEFLREEIVNYKKYNITQNEV